MSKKIKLEWPLEKHQVKLYGQVEAYILKYYGKRCKTPANGCLVCKAYAILDLIELAL